MSVQASNWMENVIKEDEIKRYLINGKDFIDDNLIHRQLAEGKNPDKSKIRDIIQKSLSIERLEPSETAALLNVTDPDLWLEIFDAAGQVKRLVYDNRIVTFAPLYLSNFCVNNCLYCGFRTDNQKHKRHTLTDEEIIRETESCIQLGHKKLIVVYGEHPVSDVHYMKDSIEKIYSVKVPTKRGFGNIRRVNVNAAPLSIDDLKILKTAGIGTYQVFQETYHHETYKRVHPSGIKAHYDWRLYTLHRAMDAGVDDVAIGALFGLYDWRFEVMGLLYHSIDLENRYGGVGPHTISFPRIQPADGVDFSKNSPYIVSDEDFKKLVAVIRLSVPYTGMILTARENAKVRHEIIPIGVTQTDASTKIGIGSYSEKKDEQETDRQQFVIGDPRSLDEVVRELAEMGYITSFCTAGYRCGRTGTKIMGMLKKGLESKFCKTNAVLTFREWLDDFATPETKAVGERLIQKEMAEIEKDEFFNKNPTIKNEFSDYYKRLSEGERDLYI